MSRYTIDNFVTSTSQQDLNQGVFELENDRILEVNLEHSKIWTRTVSMVAYRGNIKFTRENLMEHGLSRMLKRAVSGEGTQLTKAEGSGKLYLAHVGKKISVLNLQGDSLIVNGNNILAFEADLGWDVKFMKMAAWLAGGLTNIQFEGKGMVAITSHYDPLTLEVTPEHPVMTDPNATVAWSGSLTPEIKTDVSLKTFLGRGSGESVQLKFTGKGFVVVQPYEEVYYATTE
jgi:uncharacterized protein (AIM24 family)